LLLFDPRQVGKNAAMHELFKNSESSVLHLNADEADIREKLSNTTSTKLRVLFEDHKIVCIDEVQRIGGIVATLKLIMDVLKDIQVVATGSSALDLSRKL
jgi:predicted AAA+ superfamily ATPase